MYLQSTITTSDEFIGTHAVFIASVRQNRLNSSSNSVQFSVSLTFGKQLEVSVWVGDGVELIVLSFFLSCSSGTACQSTHQASRSCIISVVGWKAQQDLCLAILFLHLCISFCHPNCPYCQVTMLA